MIESISAITLATHDMARAVRFYRMLGFEVIYGGDDAAFTSFRAGTSYLNLGAVVEGDDRDSATNNSLATITAWPVGTMEGRAQGEVRAAGCPDQLLEKGLINLLPQVHECFNGHP